MQQVSFKDQQSFIQAAFNCVAKIISEHGHPCIESGTPAKSTEQCLNHLCVVAAEWSYDYSTIDAYLEVYKESNKEIIEFFGDDDL